MILYHSDQCSCHYDQKARYDRWKLCERAKILLMEWKKDLNNIEKRNIYFKHFQKIVK